MPTDKLGEPIASRELRKGDQLIIVTFDKPEQSADGDYSCAVRIEGMDPKPRTTSIFGVDSVHALSEALTFAGRLLEADDTVTWNGERDLGFPRSGR
ncbi:DUF6968 family protein [Nocardia suismassiliense]|uniref:DUF6968 family protein n=1 Tax=Nocardia suismassiliense TaxID=2077092 RepID=A0ABW6QXH6_9NOCA